MRAIPMTIKQAQAWIDDNHRHHVSAKTDKFRVGAEINGEIVGVVQVGRPVARKLDDGKTLEVLRLCSNGEKNVCSFLYSRAARIAKELGYQKIITYILESEEGTSLRASGWSLEMHNVGGGSWDVPSRPRKLLIGQMSIFQNTIQKYPTEKKQRWVKYLNL